MTSVWRFLWRGVRIYYDAFILPRAKDEDSRRREFIFNIIVSTIFTILAVFGLQIVHVELVTPGYSGVGHGTFIFFLAFFLDFFEIVFIVVPMLVPVMRSLGIDPIWFGLLLCVWVGPAQSSSRTASHGGIEPVATSCAIWRE